MWTAAGKCLAGGKVWGKVCCSLREGGIPPVSVCCAGRRIEFFLGGGGGEVRLLTA